jgi:hypothetical protein
MPYERGITKNRLGQSLVNPRLRLKLNIFSQRLRRLDLHHDFTLVI